jgi:shikimate dehydrogenase
MGRYGLIGEKLGHSFSPRIHALLGDYEYKLYPMPPEEVGPFMRDNELDAFNVTVPYKEAVIPYLADVSGEASRIGSVNTVVRGADGRFHGHNTDYHGFLRMLGDVSALTGKKAVVLGSGGASKAVRAALLDAGFSPVVVVSRTGEDNYTNLDRHRDAALVVNATPVGMYPNVDKAPVDLTEFPACARALDLIYNPLKTRFLLQAEALGIEARNGLTMLTAQAVKASELFGARAPGDDPTDFIADRLSREARSIALLGMPGSGKTSVGQAVARRMNRAFYDVDEMIVEEIGMPIPDFFALKGERAFRAVEARTLQRAAKEPGCVIATGGGIVTVPGNRAILMQNCALIQIERSLADLPSNGRPVTQKRGVEALYRERKPLYDMWSERTYENRDVEETARRIAEDYA